MLSPLSLFLALALAPSELSPVAAEHNTKAMRFYDAGQFAPAVDEFHAAYQSMPDARLDLAGREQLLGSMRATLLALHAETGEAAPLCRLQSILRGHVDALTAAFPDEPDRLETRSARARHREVTEQLAMFGADACKPPPVPAAAPISPSPAPTPAPAPAATALSRAPTGLAGRSQLIAGGVTLPLGLLALGALGAIASGYRADLAEADRLALGPCTDDDRVRMRELLQATRRDEGAMIALGLTGGGLIAAGTVLLVHGGLQRRRARLALDLRQDQVGFTLRGAF